MNNKADCDSNLEAKLVELINEESERNQRTTKTTWVVGAILVVAVFIYMSWILSTVRNEILTPQGIAEMAAGVADENVPKYLSSIEQDLKAKAPVLANQSADELIRLFPTVREEIEGVIEASEKMIPDFSASMSDGLRGYLQTHADEIRAFYKAHDERKFAQYIVDHIYETFTTDLDNSLKATFNGQGIEDFNNESLDLLSNINEKIQRIAKKPLRNLSKREVQEIRLIKTINDYLIKDL